MFFVYGEMCLCLFLVWLHKDAQWFNFYVYYCFTNDNEEEERDEWINEITQLGDFFFIFMFFELFLLIMNNNGYLKEEEKGKRYS